MSFNNLSKSFLIAFVALSLSMANVFAQNTKEWEVVKNLDIFYSVFKEVSIFYVDEVSPETLINNSINGMLDALDPYTNYIPAEEKKDFDFQTTGQYGGIGAMIRKANEFAIITEPYKNFPADIAGLKAGDKIFAIEGKQVKDLDVKGVSELLKGIPESLVNVTIIKPITNDTVQVSIQRKVITVNSVPYYGMLNDSVGYIRLARFTQNANQEVTEALSKLKSEMGAKKLILDLRGNPGGLLIESVDIANIFIPKNQLVVSTKGKIEANNSEYKTRFEPADTQIPLIVLVNSNSASASEIIAGSLQDLDRAVIVGEKTFGKGLVQSTRQLKYDAQVKITTSKYYIPSGRCIQVIDYSDKDHTKKPVADSLKNIFYTKNGRPVKEGVGINPDVTIKSEEMSNIAVSLYTENLLFDYATEFYYRNPTIPSVDSFEISDVEYNNFVVFLRDKKFDYKTESEEKLKELIKTAQNEKYYDLVEHDIKNIERLLTHDIPKDLETFKIEIKQMLKEELATRYYYQQGQIRATILSDKQVKGALDLLSNNDNFYQILNPKK